MEANHFIPSNFFVVSYGFAGTPLRIVGNPTIERWRLRHRWLAEGRLSVKRLAF
jgi:hypothetical protein